MDIDEMRNFIVGNFYLEGCERVKILINKLQTPKVTKRVRGGGKGQ